MAWLTHPLDELYKSPSCPPAITVFGSGASFAGTSMMAGVIGSLEGLSAQASVVALGEGTAIATGLIGSGGSSATGFALASMLGPLGCAIVGCDKNESAGGDGVYTWDCWKPILREFSMQPSRGMPVHRLVSHPNVQSVSPYRNGLIVENVFGERFRLDPVSVQGTLAFHASILSS
ncbi:uncharacterized protein LMH87_007547 [Akanthomyces muscarius]|uniref:Uncharacterized protein n=1 Tax=Akanthomyces muscarius TaxID=2231603 RepID=A0A9W8QJC2_AKAMU|nr:uncharacterized protein LMH87_007547 [Akanthomyces muscarius]KAJ4161509.1 hypothetical protein LMH87_007547 [Akanthomyces muscarius]